MVQKNIKKTPENFVHHPQNSNEMFCLQKLKDFKWQHWGIWGKGQIILHKFGVSNPKWQRRRL